MERRPPVTWSRDHVPNGTECQVTVIPSDSGSDSGRHKAVIPMERFYSDSDRDFRQIPIELSVLELNSTKFNANFLELISK